MSKPKIAIILVNWNGYEYTKYCILSLIKCKNTLNYKIIVVDNNSSDLSVDKLKNNFV